MKKRHVLLVVRWPVGGIRTFIRYVYRNFDPEKWRFTILAPNLNEMQFLTTDLEGINVTFDPIENLPQDGSSGIWKLFLSVALRCSKDDFDLMHSHGFISGLSASIPAFLWRIPHLMTSHDIINESQFSGIKGKIKRFVMAVLFSLINKVHSVSQDAQANLFSFFPEFIKKKQKFIVIRNGIEVERFVNAKPINLKKELNLENRTFLIGFMGRFMAQKGFCYLINAVETLYKKEKFLNKIPVVLAFGEGGFIREETQGIKDLGLEEKFRFMPFSENVAGLIKGMDVVVIPSLWEACPLLPMETLVCGIPLIGTSCIGLREVLEDTPAIVVKPKDSKGLAAAIEHEMYKSSKDKFVAFSNEAVNRYNVREQYSQLVSLYESML